MGTVQLFVQNIVVFLQSQLCIVSIMNDIARDLNHFLCPIEVLSFDL